MKNCWTIDWLYFDFNHQTFSQFRLVAIHSFELFLCLRCLARLLQRFYAVFFRAQVMSTVLSCWYSKGFAFVSPATVAPLLQKSKCSPKNCCYWLSVEDATELLRVYPEYSTTIRVWFFFDKKVDTPLDQVRPSQTTLKYKNHHIRTTYPVAFYSSCSSVHY